MRLPFPLRELRLHALVLGGLLNAASACVAETLRLRADSWMPYNGEPDSATPGYAIEVMRTILEPHSIMLDYRTMPWGDALRAAAAGEIDAVVGANHEEAQDLLLPQEPIGLPRIALMVSKTSSWRYENVPALVTARLAVILDYKYWPALDTYIEKHDAPQVIKFSGEQPLRDALAQLASGEIDVLAETSAVFAWTAKAAGYAPGAFRIAYLHQGDPVYFAFTNNDRGRRYAALLDEGLRELRRTGRLAAMLAHYGQSDWAQHAKQP